MPHVPSRAELARRVAEDGFGLKPAEFLSSIGGAAAAPDLIYLLLDEPDPVADNVQSLTPEQFVFVFRQNVLSLLRELRDPGAVEALVKCYHTYRAFDDFLVELALEQGATVPVRADTEELGNLAVVDPNKNVQNSPAHARYREKIRGTTVETGLRSPAYPRCLVGSAWLVRDRAVLALESTVGEGAREFFAESLKHERNSLVRRRLAFALARLRDPRAIAELGFYLQELAGTTAWSPHEFTEAIELLAAYSEPRARRALEEFHAKCKDSSKREYKNLAAAKLGLPEEKSKCFIATAACGSAEAPEVARLRRFREERLRPTCAGRAAIALYEFVSPPLADFIRPRPWLRAGVRAVVLKPALFGVGFLLERQNGVESAESDCGVGG
jgi:HEAT repeat protein